MLNTKYFYLSNFILGVDLDAKLFQFIHEIYQIHQIDSISLNKIDQLQSFHKMDKNQQKYFILNQRQPLDQIQKKLKQAQLKFFQVDDNMLGYPRGFSNSDNLITSLVNQFLNYRINNCGDPFICGLADSNSKNFQCAVLKYFSELWRFPQSSINLSYWGYILAMGSTEGNMMTYWTARDYLRGQRLIIDKQSIQYIPISLAPQTSVLKQTLYFCSQASHYSIQKAFKLLNVQSFSSYGNQFYSDAVIQGVKKQNQPFPEYLPTYQQLGRIDVEKFIKIIQFFASKRHAIIIHLNYGSTFTSSFDQIHKLNDNIIQIMRSYGLDSVQRYLKHPTNKSLCYKDVRRGYWVHVDGALGGTYLPYLYNHSDQESVLDQINGIKYYKKDIPVINFSKYESLCSIVVSTHKYIGISYISGIYMIKNNLRINPGKNPQYIKSVDSTLAGSRSGVPSIILWKYIATKPEKQFQIEASECLKLVRSTQIRMRQIIQQKNKKYGKDLLFVRRTPFSVSIVFSELVDELITKYTISGEIIKDQQTGQNIRWNHLYILSALPEYIPKIGRFLNEIAKEGSFKKEQEFQKIKKIN